MFMMMCFYNVLGCLLDNVFGDVSDHVFVSLHNFNCHPLLITYITAFCFSNKQCLSYAAVGRGGYCVLCFVCRITHVSVGRGGYCV